MFLLADLDIGFIVFLAISFVTWIMNLKNKDNKKPAVNRPARPAGQGGKKASVKSELEQFLEEVSGQKQPEQKPRPAPRPAPRPQREVAAQVREEKPRRRPRPQPSKTQQQKTTPKQQRPRRRPAPAKVPPPKKATLREDQERKDRQRSARPLGSGIDAHVDSYIDQHVESHINHGVNESVRQHLGNRTRETRTSDTEALASEVVAALRNPQDVKKAILIGEVLLKPRALRQN